MSNALKWWCKRPRNGFRKADLRIPCLATLLLVMVSSCIPSLGLPPAPVMDCDLSTGFPEPITLDQDWRFSTDPQDQGVEKRWYSTEVDDTAWRVFSPGSPWEVHGVEYDGIAWYRLRTVLPDWEHIYLGFGSVDDVATLWIDEQHAGVWDITQTGPVVLDLTAYADRGSEVLLAFRIQDDGLYGGLKQPVVIGPDVSLIMDGTQHSMWLAQEHPDWPLPSWASGASLAWTMTGALASDEEALMSSSGAIAPWATAPTVSLWLHDPVTGKLLTPVREDLVFSLVEGRLPIPQFVWTVNDGVSVTGLLFHDSVDGAVRFRISVANSGELARQFAALVVVRPSAVNTRSRLIHSAAFQETARLWVNEAPFLIATEPAGAVGVGSRTVVLPAALVGTLPSPEDTFCSPLGDAFAVLRYELDLASSGTRDLDFAFPSTSGAPFPSVRVDFADRLARTVRLWSAETQRAAISVPDDLLSAGVPASVGYLLLALDSDGPHPGPMAHDAVWVRDAAYIGMALLQMGHADAVAAFIPGILAAQEADGRVPPIQGPKAPWDDDEWDAQGQAIFLATIYYRFTGDIDALRDWYPALRAAARFLVTLRANDGLREGPAAGLLPPSKSVEDIGPADWHHFWDNYWAVAGLESGAYVADLLGESEDASWMHAEATSLRQAILTSLEALMGSDIPYIPSAVENLEGSAMARGTVPTLWPYEVFSRNDPLLDRAFAYYHEHWIAPHDGGFLHRESQFWPYGGLELAHAYLRLGDGGALHQILGWTLRNQTLPGTFAWAEQVQPSSGGFSGGDMPHAWAAADYVMLVREMLVSERDDSLQLFNGMPEWWLEQGRRIELRGVPTYFGPLNVETDSTVVQEGAVWRGDLVLSLSGARPPDGFRWQLPVLPDTITGPSGTVIEEGWLVVPAQGGTIQLTFAGL